MDPSRSTRLRRVLLTTAAAAVVVLVPTACDQAIAADRIPTGPNAGQQSGQYTGHSGHTAAASTTAATPQGGAPSPGAPASQAAQPGAAQPGSAQPGSAQSSGAAPSSQAAPSSSAAAPPSSQSAAPSSSAAPAPNQPNNGLEVLARDCSKSDLPPHTGFQVAPACVDTEFGEVGAANKNPSLLITDAPTSVTAGQAFQIKVSTRNLVRDRFLGAAAGGYYLESSLLDGNGIQRGHFHTACRMLADENLAPVSGDKPAFFVATQDGSGGATPDTVTIDVTGLPSKGIAQCASWAGDGSHRIPMMQRADQTPAFDAVRITVN
ncbi:hypothetical protein GCM10009836_71340 [Pseudonocardia ailaonensis]|uniref:Pecanex-like protein 1 n=1 Tax=Pseudonocardia ailaonensis TaxID=367279 RepID=A0ABN2NP70_9PSEU